MSGNGLFERFGIPPNARSSGGPELRVRCLVQFLRIALAELKSKTGLPWKQRLKAWRNGFTSWSWMIYRLDRNDPAMYLAEFRAALKAYRVNNFYNPVIGNKLLLSRLLSAHGLPHPDVVSLVLEGRLYEDNEPFEPDRRRALFRTLERYPRQVFRPVLSGNGEGIFFLDRSGDDLRLNGKKATADEVVALISGLDRYLSTEFVDQAAYAQRIHPGSTNTLRVLTLWDDETGTPFIAAVVQRFGSQRSGPTDHWHKGRGGFCASVDLESGSLGPAVSLNSDNSLNWVSSHPDSGEAIEGVAIPGLEQCLQGVLEAATCFPYCPSIGWDVALTDKGFSLLEANTTQGLSLMQVHTPLLKDPRTRAFYRRWGMA